MSGQKSLGISKESFSLTLGNRLTIPLAVAKNTPVKSKGSLIYDPVLVCLFYSDGNGWIEITDSTTNVQCIMNEAGDTSVCTDTHPPTDSKIIYFTTQNILRAIFSTLGVFIATGGSVDPTTIVPGVGQVANFQGDVSVTGSVLLSIPLAAIYGGTGQNSYNTGDTLYSLVPNTLSKLPIGTVDQVYTVSGGVPSWQDPQIIQTGPETPNTQANGDNYEFLPVEIDGNSRYIPLTSTPALNAQNDGGKLICMGTDVVGGPSGVAYTKIQAAAASSHVIGNTACRDWNVSTTTAGALVVLGPGALQFTSATSTHSQDVVIGRLAMQGGTTPYTGSSTQNVVVGNNSCSNYQFPSNGVIIGYNAMTLKPVTSADASRVAIGASVLANATLTGGSNYVVIGTSAMQSCTATLFSGAVVVGDAALQGAKGQFENANIFIGRSICANTTFGGSSHRNVVIGGTSINAAASSMGSNNVMLGGFSLVGNGAGMGSNSVVIGSETFTANVAALNSSIVCVGHGQTGVPNASEVMFGNLCAAAGVTGRLSFGNAMEAIAATATAGAAALPAAPAGFLVIRHNGTVRKLPVYNN